MKCSRCGKREVTKEPRASAIYEYLNRWCLECYIEIMDSGEFFAEEHHGEERK